MSETCVLCRAKVDNGYITPLGLKGENAALNVAYNNNGTTYITHNGIIVLSDADYTAFINGELTIEELHERLGLLYD